MHKKIFIKIKVKLTYNKEKCFKLKKNGYKKLRDITYVTSRLFFIWAYREFNFRKETGKKVLEVSRKKFFSFFLKNHEVLKIFLTSAF